MTDREDLEHLFASEFKDRWTAPVREHMRSLGVQLRTDDPGSEGPGA